MFSSDWSLVLFTVLTQTAVGIIVISEITRLAVGKSGAPLRWQVPAACLLTALGLIFSLTHLGTPLHSVFTILNLGSSWLSREILSVGAFFILILLLMLQRRKNPEAKAVPLAVAAVVVGLGAVFVMTKVYLLPTVPVWNSISTAVGFYGTMLLSGAVAGGLVGSLEIRHRADGGSTGTATIMTFSAAAMTGLVLKFIGIVLSMIALNNADNFGMNGLAMVADEGVAALVARIVMICAGVTLFIGFAFKAMHAQVKHFVNPALCAVVLVLAGEIIGRLMFYGTYLRIGI
ncbi:MAG: dimethyl sulfoxide reductase anchor subunit family protein [Pseudodesulfovibrio sp.]|uniref:dimethyl sulfoxide reductase anchor subunit family protein n=1 Tax=Pseudodesulfovibrio sp. TaxID=2035812 RepID=UPI003D149C7F